MPETEPVHRLQGDAPAWFAALRDRICAALERLEDEAAGPFDPEARRAGRFARKPWQRTDHSGAAGGGGVMAMMRGRVFEKVGVHVSTVHGEFAPEFRGQIPGADEDPRFWASGISLIAHPWNPQRADRAHEHALRRDDEALVRRRRRPDPGARPPPHARTIPTRSPSTPPCAPPASGHAVRRLRALQGVVRRVLLPASTAASRAASAASSTTITGRAIRTRISPSRATSARPSSSVYPEIVRRNLATPWTEADREEQLVRRGRYVEFNLLYDRGTIFGLKTGGNVESILSSMPPTVRWPLSVSASQKARARGARSRRR